MSRLAQIDTDDLLEELLALIARWREEGATHYDSHIEQAADDVEAFIQKFWGEIA